MAWTTVSVTASVKAAPGEDTGCTVADVGKRASVRGVEKVAEASPDTPKAGAAFEIDSESCPPEPPRSSMLSPFR
jgi:hypothetical protein